ncbi:phosphoglycerate mutase family protein [Ligilactobacillus sp. Marseille-Q7487]|uniref:histidine phosphatase family protein n=1 Tax=Ligilactobacillus sp. Marseille-Q7487 TaxID=3022128 RepID=UPI0024A80C31|nr:phosphoglycerate mutase family protein [Ligilactobacillus sp. Marseille-Q7487]
MKKKDFKRLLKWIGEKIMTINVYLVRHGQTMFNVFNRMQGWADSPLTTKGKEDAKKAGKVLEDIHFDGAYSSDTMRAYQTCQSILDFNQASGVKVPQASSYFREQNYGFFEGYDVVQTWRMVGYAKGLTTFKELSATYSLDEIKDLMFQADPFKVCEDCQNYWQRIDAGWDLIRQNHYEGQNILVVAHSNSIASLVQKYAPEYKPAQNYPSNGAITQLQVTPETIIVTKYNQLSI